MMCVASAGYFIYLNWIPSYFYKVIVATLHSCATRMHYWLPFFGAAQRKFILMAIQCHVSNCRSSV